MTKTTIMRSKQLPPAIGRPIHGVRTSYGGGVVYPQWMRALEEKYQRIHMKIARSTTAMTNLYNSNLGRNNIQDKSLITPSLSATREPSSGNPKAVSPYRNRRVVSSLEKRCISRGARVTATQISDLKQDITEEAGVDCANNAEEHPDNSDNESYANSEDENNPDDKIQETPPHQEDVDNSDSDDTDAEGQEVPNSVGEADGADTNSSSSKEDLDTCQDKAIPNDTTIKRTYKSAGERRGQRTTFVTSLGKHYHTDRLVRREKIPRTSTSHRSIQTQKTTKSCPAVMDGGQAKSHLQNSSKTKVAHRRKQGGTRHHLDMFSRMSMEAQHAMTETIQEIRPIPDESDSKKVKNEQVKVVFNESAKLDEDDTDNVIHSATMKNAPRKPNEGYFHDSKSPSNNIMKKSEDVFSDSDNSVPSRDRTKPIALIRKTKLPNITDGNYISLQHLQTLQCHLPGIGRYNVAASRREQTFEITPPGYDIRYTDMMVVEERESETPPADIKNRAVQKCQDWLSRYTPR